MFPNQAKPRTAIEPGKFPSQTAGVVQVAAVSAGVSGGRERPEQAKGM